MRSFAFPLSVALLAAPPLFADLGADALDVIAPPAADTLDGVGAAEAAFIRRSKLKQKRVVGYKVVVTTQWDESDDTDSAVDAVEVTFPTVGDGGSGDTIPPQTSGYRLKGDKHFKGLISQWPATYSFSVTVDPGDGSATTVEVPVEGLEPTVVGSETTVVTDLGVKANLRILDVEGTLKVRVFHEDGAWDPSTVSNVSVAGVDVPYVRTTRRFVATVDDSGLGDTFGDGSGYTISTVAKDAAGNVLATSTSGEVVGGGGDGPDIAKVRVSEKNNGDLKIRTWTDSLGVGAASVQVLVQDADGEGVHSALDDMAARTEALWVVDTLTFDDPASAADQPYGLVLNLFDPAGNSIGASDVEIVVEGLAGVDAAPPPGTPFTAVTADAEVSGRVAIRQIDATNFALSVAIEGAQVGQVEVEITDLVGNPSQPDSVFIADPDYRVRRWETIAEPLSPAGSPFYTVTVEMLDPDDVVIDTVTGTVSSFPSNAYKRAGDLYDSGAPTTVKGSKIDLNP